MQDADFASAKTIKDTIAKIVGAQTKAALSGSRVQLSVTNADGSVELLSHKDLKTLLGDTSYNTICSTALTSVSTALTSLKTAQDSAFAALGEA